MGIPDDGTMEAALYGTAHIETLLHYQNSRRLLEICAGRIESIMSTLDLDLADRICTDDPVILGSDADPDQDRDEVQHTIHALREVLRLSLASDLIRSWMTAADRRGRLIGLGEHSARETISGTADEHFKPAWLRFGGV